jgi:hypothetical protein
VYLLGNPFVVWGTSLGIVLWGVSAFAYLHFRRDFTLPRKPLRALRVCRSVVWRSRGGGNVSLIYVGRGHRRDSAVGFIFQTLHPFCCCSS